MIPAAEVEKKVDGLTPDDFADDLMKIANAALEDQAIGPALTNVELEGLVDYIDRIRHKCVAAAKLGKFEVDVLDFSYSDFYNGKSTPQDLKPLPRWIFKWCEDNKLNPVIKEWHDGGGMNGGYRLYVYWPKRNN